MRSPLALALLLPAVALSGCLVGGSDGKAFDAVPAPDWRAGYSWTYRVTDSQEESPTAEAEGYRHESETRDVTLTVFNTTTPLLDEAVYYVRSDHSLDSPLWEGEVMAYRQSDLELVGVGYERRYAYAEPVPATMQASPDGTVRVISPMPPRDPCAGKTLIEPATGHEAFPSLRFPLDDGQVWTGRWGEDEDFAFDFQARVHGLTRVTVPAGTFDAVQVTVDFLPVTGFAPPGAELPSIRVRAQYWYSEDVGYLVKSLVTASGTIPDEEDGGSFRYESRSELASFDRSAAPETPAPVVRREVPPGPPRGFEIVTDAEFPKNIAEGPVTAQFGLRAAAPGSGWGDVRHAEAVPTTADIDHTLHQVVWRVSTGHRFEVASHVGDSFSYTFERGGRFQIQAEVAPIECGAPWLGASYGEVTTFWEKTWRVNVPPGAAQTLPVGEFPVEDGARGARLEWRAQPAFGTGVDQGEPRLSDPAGTAVPAHPSGTRQAEFLPHPEGAWKLSWAAEGPDLTYGVGVPVVAGDDVTLSLRIDY